MKYLMLRSASLEQAPQQAQPLPIQGIRTPRVVNRHGMLFSEG